MKKVMIIISSIAAVLIIPLTALVLILADGDVVLFWQLLVENKFQLIQWIVDSKLWQ